MNEEPIVDQVGRDLFERSRVGVRKYGTLLYANNGRDALKDAYEECLDQSMYLKQAMIERDALARRVQELEEALQHVYRIRLRQLYETCPSCLEGIGGQCHHGAPNDKIIGRIVQALSTTNEEKE
jgi:hypothetical protein